MEGWPGGPSPLASYCTERTTYCRQCWEGRGGRTRGRRRRRRRFDGFLCYSPPPGRWATAASGLLCSGPLSPRHGVASFPYGKRWRTPREACLPGPAWSGGPAWCCNRRDYGVCSMRLVEHGCGMCLVLASPWANALPCRHYWSCYRRGEHLTRDRPSSCAVSTGHRSGSGGRLGCFRRRGTSAAT